MSNKLENYVLETEDGYITENQEAKEALDNLFIKLPSLTAEQWSEMFDLINSNSLGGKINANVAYVVAFPQMLSRYVKELNSPAYEEFEKFTEIQNIKNPFEELSSIVKIY